MFRKLVLFVIMLAVASAAAFGVWAYRPIIGTGGQSIDFSIKSGSGLRSSVEQIARAGVPVQPLLLALLAQVTGNSKRLKSGSYDVKPGTTPMQMLDQLVRGQVAQESIAIIEGWTFRQMRLAIATHPALKQETANWTDQQILARLGSAHEHPEGLFFPDTYMFAKGASDMQIYRQAYTLMQKRLADEWARRSTKAPYKLPYEALIMASIVEKETGQREERELIAAVFVNRLRVGMLLQTDPTVIYGIGQKFDGDIRKRDLQTDTPYNTYMRGGLPPTPIALPGAESLAAALNPAESNVLYFVSRGDGSSHFSTNLDDHNRAVSKYQLGR